MFGMPTRTRNLYHGVTRLDDEMETVDRDVEMAIYEFAPGRVTIKDKRGFEAIGFVPPLVCKTNHDRSRQIIGHGSAFSGRLELVHCPSCNAWSHFTEEREECSECGAPLPNDPHPTLEPAGFLADFVQEHDPTEFKPGTRHQVTHILTDNVSWGSVDDTNLAFGTVTKARTLKVNRGPDGEGFSVQPKEVVYWPNSRDTAKVGHAWVDSKQCAKARNNTLMFPANNPDPGIPERFWLAMREKRLTHCFWPPGIDRKGLLPTVVPRIGGSGRPDRQSGLLFSICDCPSRQSGCGTNWTSIRRSFEFFDPRMVSDARGRITASCDTDRRSFGQWSGVLCSSWRMLARNRPTSRFERHPQNH